MDIVENTAKRLVAFFPEYNHTFMNVLKEELRQDASVSSVAYNIDHPLVGKPKLILEVSKGSTKAALAGAIKRLRANNKAFMATYKKA